MPEDACAAAQPEDIFSEVEALVKNGYKEIVLTGIHISSYGMDFAGEKISYNSQDFTINVTL